MVDQRLLREELPRHGVPPHQQAPPINAINFNDLLVGYSALYTYSLSIQEVATPKTGESSASTQLEYADLTLPVSRLCTCFAQKKIGCAQCGFAQCGFAQCGCAQIFAKHGIHRREYPRGIKECFREFLADLKPITIGITVIVFRLVTDSASAPNS